MKQAIKICGIKKESEVVLINHYPLSYAGLIFAESKRQVNLVEGARLRSLIRGDIKVVGVFMNQDMEFVKEAIDHCHLDYVQLHGDETNEDIKELPVPVWKSISISDEKSLEGLKDYPDAEGILLDTFHKGASGGTGVTFNWDLVKDLDLDQTFILAGGLSPDNVVDAIETVKPDILDLNSGLEVELIKNEDKVKALFEQLKEAVNG